MQLQKNDSKQQCRDLLTLLHNSDHPQAFVQLYHAIEDEPHLQWLIDRIDEYSDQSEIDLLQQLYISEKKGKCWSSLQNLSAVYVFLPLCRYASVVFAVIMCPSVCPLHVRVLQKWLISAAWQPKDCSFIVRKISTKFRRDHPKRGHQMHVG